MHRLLIVSNRLPITIEKRKGNLRFRQSAGGLATGLGSFYKSFDSLWIGWCGIPSDEVDMDEKRDVEAKLISDYKSHFKLDGTPIGGSHSTGLVSMNATASLAATHERAKLFVEELWNTPIPSGQYRYFDGMLYLLGMLNCSGQFRIWSPQ